MGEYLEFVEIEPKPRTKVWQVKSTYTGEVLGKVQWYGPWHKYTFQPGTGTIFDRACLKEVHEFVLVADSEHKSNRGG